MLGERRTVATRLLTEMRASKEAENLAESVQPPLLRPRTMKRFDQDELAAIAAWLAQRQPTKCPRPGSGQLLHLPELSMREHMNRAVLRARQRATRPLVEHGDYIRGELETPRGGDLYLSGD